MANQRLSAKIVVGAALDRTFGGVVGGIRDGFKKVGSEIQTAERKQRDLTREIEKMRRAGKPVDDLMRDYDALGSSLDDLRRKQKNYERAMDASRRVGDQFRSTARGIVKVAGLAAAGITTATAAMTAAAISSVAEIEEIGTAARRLEVRPEFFSEIAYAGRQLGVQNDALLDGLKELQLRGDEFAKTGKGSAEEAFTRLGYSMKEIEAYGGDVAAMFDDVRNRMAAISDAGARQRISDELFGGTGGEQFIEMLRISREEFEGIRAEAREVGAVVSQDMVDSARKYDRAMGRVRGSITGVKWALAADFLPMVTEAAVKVGDAIVGNVDQIREIGALTAAWLGDALPKAWELARGVAKVGATLGSMVGQVAEAVGGWENLGRAGAWFIALGLTAKVALLAVSVLRLGVALMRVAGAGPAAAVAIRAVGVAAATASGSLATGAVIALGRAFVGLRAAGAIAVTAIRAVGVALIANPIGAAVALIAGAAVLIWQKWDWLKERFPSITGAISAAGDVMRSALGTVVDWLRSVPSVIISAWQAVVTFFEDMWDRIVEKFEWGKEKITAVGNAVSAGANSITGATKGPISSGYDPAADAGNDVIAPPIPQSRAIGGGFSAGRPLRVGENGEEMIFPDVGGWVAHNGKVRDLARSMRDAAGKAASALSNATSAAPSTPTAHTAPAGPISVTIVQQPGQSAQSLLDELERRLARRGGRAMFDGVA